MVAPLAQQININLLEFPINIDTIRMGLPIVCFKGSHVEFLNHIFLSLDVVLI